MRGQESDSSSDEFHDASPDFNRGNMNDFSLTDESPDHPPGFPIPSFYDQSLHWVRTRPHISPSPGRRFGLGPDVDVSHFPNHNQLP